MMFVTLIVFVCFQSGLRSPWYWGTSGLFLGGQIYTVMGTDVVVMTEITIVIKKSDNAKHFLYKWHWWNKNSLDDVIWAKDKWYHKSCDFLLGNFCCLNDVTEP